MERKTSKFSPLFIWTVVGALLSQHMVIHVMSTSIEDQKNFYFHHPDPHVPGGSHGSPPYEVTPPPHEVTPPISHGTPPSHGSYNPTPSPPSGGNSHGTPPSHGSYNPTPSPPSGGNSHGTPPSHGSYNPTPSPPSGGNCASPPHEPTPSSPPHHPTPSTPSTPSGGGYYHSPPTSHGSPPTPIIETPPISTTPTPTPPVPTPPFLPDPNSPVIGTCNYWRTHPGVIWGLLGWWGTMGSAFGVTSFSGFGAHLTVQQALSNTLRDSFVTALNSNKAAAAQAHLFKLANEGRLKPRA
uniref:Uncharacterized protein n=1 Tax=Fagus sylvatica TaxID=28930 RepID=A0A2N9GPW0_FAGSY